jgi:hypothetical protein
VVDATAADGSAITSSVAIGKVSNLIGIGTHAAGRLDIPALPPGVTYVQAVGGDNFTVLLRSDGTVVGVGDNRVGQLDIPPLPPGVSYVQVDAGDFQTVLLRSDGVAIAIGAGGQGLDIPDLPTGATYTQVSFFDSGRTPILLLSDGTAVRSAAPVPDRTTASTRYQTYHRGWCTPRSKADIASRCCSPRRRLRCSASAS